MATAVYNGYSLPYVYDKFTFRQSYTNAFFSCRFLIDGSSASDLVSKCNVAERKLSEWNKNFSLNFGGNSEYSFSHSENSGFLARPTVVVLSDRTQSMTTRGYVFTLEMQLPANQTGYNYRQEGNIAVSVPNSERKVITITGKYTAGGDKSALENYESYFQEWAEPIVDSVLEEENWEQISEDYNYEQEKKILSFTRKYQQKLLILISYNEYSIPGSYYKFSRSLSYENASVSVDFAVEKANVSAMEEKLREKDAAFSLTYGTSTINYDPNTDKGYLATPSLQKIDNLEESGTLEYYRFTVNYQLPATKTGDGFRREGSFAITYDGARRKRVSFTVTYTAGGGNTALANYQDEANGAKAWAESILSTLGFTVGGSQNYEFVSEQAQEEHRGAILNASFVVQQILTPESSGGLQDSEIVNPQIRYQVQIPNTENVSISEAGFVHFPAATVTIAYSLQIDSEKVSDTDMHNVYENKVQPWVLEQAKSILDLSNVPNSSATLIALSEQYSIDPTTYAIAGGISAVAPSATDVIIEYQEIISQSDDEGKSFTKIWDGVDFTYSTWGIGKERTLTRSISITQLGIEPAIPDEMGGNWILRNRSQSKQINRLGIGTAQGSGGQASEIFSYTKQFREDYIFVEPAE